MRHGHAELQRVVARQVAHLLDRGHRPSGLQKSGESRRRDNSLRLGDDEVVHGSNSDAQGLTRTSPGMSKERRSDSKKGAALASFVTTSNATAGVYRASASAADCAVSRMTPRVNRVASTACLTTGIP